MTKKKKKGKKPCCECAKALQIAPKKA